jgi:Gluconate 2-dehydrogenase subunit 3
MRGLLDAKQLPMMPLVPDAVATTKTFYFTERQMATLRQLCEILLPPLKQNPGALDAGTPEFLDFLISISPPDRQKMYEMGLNRLDEEARHRFGIPFDAVDASQADALLRPWLRSWMPDHPPTEPYEQFLNLAHSDIRTATINSKAWDDATRTDGDKPPGVGLYWYPVDADVQRRYLPRR